MRGSVGDHADWMRRASRISTGERRAQRGVERRIGVWLWGGRLSGGLGDGWRRSRGPVLAAGIVFVLGGALVTAGWSRGTGDFGTVWMYADVPQVRAWRA